MCLLTDYCIVFSPHLLELECWKLLPPSNQGLIVEAIKRYKANISASTTNSIVPVSSVGNPGYSSNDIVHSPERKRRKIAIGEIGGEPLDPTLHVYRARVSRIMYAFGDVINPDADAVDLMTKHIFRWIVAVIDVVWKEKNSSTKGGLQEGTAIATEAEGNESSLLMQRRLISYHDIFKVFPDIRRMYSRWRKLKVMAEAAERPEELKHTHSSLGETVGDGDASMVPLPDSGVPDPVDGDDDDEYTGAGDDGDGDGDGTSQDTSTHDESVRLDDGELPDYFLERLDFLNRRTSLMTLSEYKHYGSCREVVLMKGMKLTTITLTLLGLNPLLSKETINVMNYLLNDQIGSIIENSIRVLNGGVLVPILEPLITCSLVAAVIEKEGVR
jgi:hypothetical protein